MAKGSGKTTFKDTVTAYERLRREIAAGRYAPVYLLMGEEGYFIDRIADQLAGTVLTEAERDFNQIVVYGKDTDEGTIINYARQMPMMGRYEVVIVKEAQSLRKPEQLSLYTAAPSPSTILVVCYKGKSLDKRTQLYKHQYFLAIFRCADQSFYDLTVICHPIQRHFQRYNLWIFRRLIQ